MCWLIDFVFVLFKVHALSKSLELDFLELACLCKAVICCRVTPLQKVCTFNWSPFTVQWNLYFRAVCNIEVSVIKERFHCICKAIYRTILFASTSNTLKKSFIILSLPPNLRSLDYCTTSHQFVCLCPTKYLVFGSRPL